MTDERPGGDSDDEQSEESSDVEAINGDADDTKDTVANDTQMRYSPSFLLENPQDCVETDVEQAQRVSRSWRGRGCGQLSKQLLKRHVEPQNQSSKELCHKPSRPGAQRRQAQR